MKSIEGVTEANNERTENPNPETYELELLTAIKSLNEL